MTKFVQLLKDESGATAIEYGLIASLIAIAIIAGASSLGTQLNSSFEFIKGKIVTSGGGTTP